MPTEKRSRELGAEDGGEKRSKKNVGDDEAQQMMAKAEAGDVKAMCLLGDWYCSEEHDLPQDDEESYYWFKRASDLNDAYGMTEVGYCLTEGCGVAKNTSDGVKLTKSAADLGSGEASMRLGYWYRRGLNDLPMDNDLAKKWLKKATEGSCTVQILNADNMAHAKEAILELDKGDE